VHAECCSVGAGTCCACRVLQCQSGYMLCMQSAAVSERVRYCKCSPNSTGSSSLRGGLLYSKTERQNVLCTRTYSVLLERTVSQNVQCTRSARAHTGYRSSLTVLSARYRAVTTHTPSPTPLLSSPSLSSLPSYPIFSCPFLSPASYLLLFPLSLSHPLCLFHSPRGFISFYFFL
jgi:hypothetical protein